MGYNSQEPPFSDEVIESMKPFHHAFNNPNEDNRPLWERIKEIEEGYNALKSSGSIKEIYGTLYVNYGPESRKGIHIVEKSDTAMAMLIKVLTYFHDKVEHLESHPND